MLCRSPLDNILSNRIEMIAGASHGGILLTILFALYMDV